MVIQKILSYLVDHPDAKDTIQGILQWWLSHGGTPWRQEEVQAALDGLVARGWLTHRHTPSCQMLYGMNIDTLEEIREFLRDLDGEAECSST
jgi:hypothetical protein